MLKQFVRVVAITGISASLIACGSSYRPDSPDVRYRSAQSYEALQLPPDVAGARGQQYVIPDARSSSIARSDVLPSSDSIVLKRDGAVSWLDIQSPPTQLWPELVAFVESRGMALELNNATTGMLVTQWVQPERRTDRAGIFQKLIGAKKNINKDEIERFVIRLERTDNDSSRLFARYNLFQKGVEGDKAAWAYNNDDELRSSELLSQILLWFGVNEQKAKGMLSEMDAQAIHQNVQLETHDELSYLLLWDDYESAFDRIKNATDKAGLVLEDDDINIGLIEVTGDMTYLQALKSRQNEILDSKEGLFNGLGRMVDSVGDSGMALELRFLRVESGVYAVDVRDPEIGIIEGAAAQLILKSLRDALLAG